MGAVVEGRGVTTLGLDHAPQRLARGTGAK